MRRSQQGGHSRGRAVGRRARWYLPAALPAFLLVLLAVQPAWAVDRISIDMSNDSNLLSYAFRPERADITERERQVILRPLAVIQTGVTDSLPAQLLTASNLYGSPEVASVMYLYEYPWKQHSFLRLKYPLCDLAPYYDHQTGRIEVVAAMFGRDTAFVVRILPREGQFEVTPLCTMAPRGEGDEETRMLILLTDDYDYDGQTEAIIYVYSPRPQDWRGLCCVDIENGRVEWSLPVASPILWRDLYSLQDSLNPGVIFHTRTQGLGNTDSLFNDFAGQLAVVNRLGQVEICKTIERRVGTAEICPAETHGQFYLSHNCFDDRRLSSDSDSVSFRLSKINRAGDVLRTVELPTAAGDIWLGPYGPDHPVALWVVETRRGLRVLDSAFNVLAISDPADIGWDGQRIRLAPFDDTVLMFSGEVLELDDYRSLSQAAMPDFFASEFQPITYDEQGRIDVLALVRPNGWIIGRYEQREFLELLTILYVRYQTPMLMTVTGLVVALVLVNFFRYRNKSTARLISRQKQELEQIHQKLKEAQATIVAQEKYRQARDIAGGFAHEIRNALFPAEAALHKLLNRRNPSADEAETTRRYLGTATAAVTRAIGVTELISSYTRLESEAAEEAVDLAAIIREVIEANRLRSQEQGVVVESPGGTGWWVRSNQKQLYMVINNLVVNSLDALTGRPTPRIVLAVGRDADFFLLSVTDNGSGIAAEALPRVFDTFYSTKPSTGNGLGLAIAKRIVELYGGTISVVSEPDAWTRFDLRFRATSPPA